MPASLADPSLQASAVVVLGGLAVAAMTLTLFDLAAALLFAGPVLLPLALRLLSLQAPLPLTMRVAGAMIVLQRGVALVLEPVAAGAARQVMADAWCAGFADCLTKPVHMPRLLALVDQTLR